MTKDGYCLCGCGEKTKISNETRPERGWVKNVPRAYIRGHNHRVARADSFWAKVEKHGPNECWEWQGQRGHKGHGRMKYRGKSYGAHRISWEIANGPIPEGLFVCHRCDNPPCVNPTHLFVGSQKENLDDMRAKGRENFARGSKVAGSVLTEDQVIEIKSRLNGGALQKDLAPEYGVSSAAIQRIASGRNWAWVKVR